MPRLLIFGNSGSGKSTLAQAKAEAWQCPHLDLDTVAWLEDVAPPTRRPIPASQALVTPFLAANDEWVIEGCYADLLDLVTPHATELIFLNPGVETCLVNSRARPWEPHKYESPEAQQANLEMLLEWIAQYPLRDDEFSLQAHRKLYDEFSGPKREYTSNSR